MTGSGEFSAPVSIDDAPDTGKQPVSLHIENYHHHPHSLTELRKIAEVDPDLAHAIVTSQDAHSRRRENSFRIGLVAATAIALAGLGGFVAIVVFIGWWQALLFIPGLLTVSHLVRAVLTGEWSDTSWFGKLLQGAKSPPE